MARKGEQKAHYFAHYCKAECNGESLLHYISKNLLTNRIANAIRNKTPIPIQWSCDICQQLHKGNLVKIASNVSNEEKVGPCRPYIILRDDQNQIIAFIEIVVSHSPENYVFRYSYKNNIKIIVLKISNFGELDLLLSSKELFIDDVGICTTPKCPECQKPLQIRYFYIIDTRCWKCKKVMKAAFSVIDGNIYGPETFNNFELMMARENSVLMQLNFSKTMMRSYISNTCKNCESFIDDFFLHKYSSQISKKKPKQIQQFCKACHKIINNWEK